MGSTDPAAERLRSLVSEYGGAEMAEALQEFLAEAGDGERLQRALDTLRALLEPLVEQVMSSTTAREVLGDLEGLLATVKLEAQKTPRASLGRRMSQFMGLGGRTASKKAEADDDDGDESDSGDEGDDDYVDDDDDDDDDEEDAVPDKSARLQWAARRQTGYEGNLTARQKQDLERFRAIMSATQYKDDIERHRDGADRLLLRFLRAECTKKRRFRLERSQKRLETTLQWRRDRGIDQLLTNEPPEMERFLDINGELETMDNEGRVLVFTRAAIVAASLDVKEFSKETWELCIATMVERRMQKLRESSERLGYEVSTICMVYDFRGPIGLGARRMLPFFKILNGIASAHYPELIDSLFVPGAPRIFGVLFGLVAPFLDPVTKEKVNIFSWGASGNSKFVATLLEHVDADQIPKEYGGTGTMEMPMPAHARAKKLKVPKPFAA